MNYFTSGIHGNIEVYKELRKLAADKDNHIWILGDIFDGNEDKPEACIEILNDIFMSDNITLLLGDHEYYHALRIMSREDPDRAENWADLLQSMDVNGQALMDYIDSLPEDDINDIANKLYKTEVTEMVRIGEKLFYLCHGAPAIRTGSDGGNMNWQFNVVGSSIDPNIDYSLEMSSDIRIDHFQKTLSSIDFRKTIIISGHTSIEEMEEEDMRKLDGIYFENKKFCLNQGYPQPDIKDWYILGVDAGGFFTQTL